MKQMTIWGTGTATKQANLKLCNLVYPVLAQRDHAEQRLESGVSMNKLLDSNKTVERLLHSD